MFNPLSTINDLTYIFSYVGVCSEGSCYVWLAINFFLYIALLSGLSYLAASKINAVWKAPINKVVLIILTIIFIHIVLAAAINLVSEHLSEQRESIRFEVQEI